jgi:hypothetical protein
LYYGNPNGTREKFWVALTIPAVRAQFRGELPRSIANFIPVRPNNSAPPEIPGTNGKFDNMQTSLAATFFKDITTVNDYFPISLCVPYSYPVFNAH